MKYWENYPYVNFNQNTLILYFELMCIIDRKSVIPSLKEDIFKDIYPKLLNICENFGCLEGKAFLLDKGGDSRGALDIYF